jgi:hypothetical protein
MPRHFPELAAMRIPLLILSLLASVFIASVSDAAPACSGHSPAHTVALLELYTSEGCSSCPPADQFVSSLRGTGLGADQVLPLSLHVDYWNDIGWKDPFSSSTFTERQRALSALARSRTVYTPELFVGGHEVRNWPDGIKEAVRKTNAQPARARIAIDQHGAADGLHVEVSGQGPAGALLQVALVQNSLVSQVKRGENAGRTLRHDFVARRWFDASRLDGSGTGRQNITLRADQIGERANLSLTAFVQSAQGEILQAYALPLCVPGQP